MKRLLFVLFVLSAASPAWADALYDKCMNDSKGTNYDWSVCGGEWLQRADRKLNEVWKLVYGKAEGQTKSDLLAEQRAWNAYKETSCTFYQNDDWGREGQVLHYPNCRAGIIEDRIKQLQEYGKFIGGE